MRYVKPDQLIALSATAPSAAWLTEFRTYAGLGEGDTLAADALAQAREQVEGAQGLCARWWSVARLSATWFDPPAGDDVYALTGGPFGGVATSLTFTEYDQDGEERRRALGARVLPAVQFGVELHPVHGATPAWTGDVLDGNYVVCDYAVGNEEQPEAVKRATFMLAAHYHAHRGSEDADAPNWGLVRAALAPVVQYLEY